MVLFNKKRHKVQSNTGNVFQRHGPADATHQSPSLLCQHRMIYIAMLTEQSRYVLPPEMNDSHLPDMQQQWQLTL